MFVPISLAFLSGCLYYLGFVFFKEAAAVLPPLRGTQPGHFLATVVRNGRWLAGVTLMGGGVVIQVVAAPRLSLPVLVTALLAGLVPLVALSVLVTGERIGGAEAAWLTAMAAGGLLVSWSDPPTPAEIPGASLALLALPSLGLPILLFTIGDVKPDGRHARPLTGIAYGIGAGILVGLAELAFNLQARADFHGPLTIPLLLLFLTAVTIGVAQLQMALQRCRLLTVVFVATVVAKAYLVIGYGLVTARLPGESFGAFWLLVPGVVLIGVSLVLIPRHEPAAEDPADALPPLPPARPLAPPAAPVAPFAAPPMPPAAPPAPVRRRPQGPPHGR
ncbi:hypothetical protein EDD29_2615 [Actinocorallia herbida]|uniref:Magnesium transporter NIPA n=1 Tax=Actinocorallia herbida TaxID=58109 RepID=A0A3N1CUV0_9ACTN|nr:hypothetical protein [Actinocorallia herbida]ROO85080.1 hypothetical protein EDD29_2615 [Actinocorallia herbida]